MWRNSLNDLSAFFEVASERSFTRAAAKLGISPSALSHSMKALEEKIGIRLLTRTTRSVTPTDAGEQLLLSIKPMFETLEQQLYDLTASHSKAAGTIRITADEPAVNLILIPKLKEMLTNYPDIAVEISSDGRLVDIVSERFDAGVRLGEIVDESMIGVPISEPIKTSIVASPTYLAKNGVPKSPYDLDEHNCIALRLNTSGGIYLWEFQKDGEPFRVKVSGQTIFNTLTPIMAAATTGMGIGYLPYQMVEEQIRSGELVSILEAWTLSFSPYYLYYPSRRHQSSLFKLFVETLRWKGESLHQRTKALQPNL